VRHCRKTVLLIYSGQLLVIVEWVRSSDGPVKIHRSRVTITWKTVNVVSHYLPGVFYARRHVVLSTYGTSYRNYVCLSVCLSRPGIDSSPCEIETPGFYRMTAQSLVCCDQILCRWVRRFDPLERGRQRGVPPRKSLFYHY